MKTTLEAMRMLLVLTVLTGFVYPFAVTGFAKVFFPRAAAGSLIYDGDKLVGSELLAQKFEKAHYFSSRPSAVDYATVPSGASNKGLTSTDLAHTIAERRVQLGADAPADLLTASGSGLDPHISSAAAQFQIARVAAARALPNERVAALVAETTEAPQLGFLGEERVNVLRLNRRLDEVR